MIFFKTLCSNTAFFFSSSIFYIFLLYNHLGIFYLRESQDCELQLLGSKLNTVFYGIAVQKGSKLLTPLNAALLGIFTQTFYCSFSIISKIFFLWKNMQIILMIYNLPPFEQQHFVLSVHLGIRIGKKNNDSKKGGIL